MQELSYKPKAHLLICTRLKENKECCAQKGSEQMVEELKKWVKEKGLKSEIKVSQSSCLGSCESGITACLYPENLWYHNIGLEDLEKLKKMLKERAK